MLRFSIAILLVAFLQNQCQQIQGSISQKAEAALVPYFPHARSAISNGVLIAYTCADLGIKAIQQLPATLDRDPQVQQMKQNNFLVGLVGVRAFALGFPNAILVLNLQTKQYQIVAADPGYIQQYTMLCNPAPAYSVMAPPAPAPPPPPPPPASAPASPGFAERPVVNGYPMLEAYRVYSPADEVRIDVPHGGSSGLMAMNIQYFVRLLEVTIVEQHAIVPVIPGGTASKGIPASKGILTAQVRHATDAQWQEQRAFSFQCEGQSLRTGDIELAHYVPALTQPSYISAMVRVAS
jgi:hypothetical protein